MTVVSIVLGLLPAILLAVALVLGRYPGEATLARLRTSRRRHPPAVSPPSGSGRARAAVRRGGELLSGPRSGRSPPTVPA